MILQASKIIFAIRNIALGIVKMISSINKIVSRISKIIFAIRNIALGIVKMIFPIRNAVLYINKMILAFILIYFCRNMKILVHGFYFLVLMTLFPSSVFLSQLVAILGWQHFLEAA
jgi:hypothetical protein